MFSANLGELSMQKVKVQRYISGKKPDYANDDSSSEDTDLEDFIDNRRRQLANQLEQRITESVIDDNKDDEANKFGEIDDPRLKRLKAISVDAEELNRQRLQRHREIHAPEVLDESDSDSSERKNEDEMKDQQNIQSNTGRITLASESDSDTDLSENELEKRRLRLRQRMLQQQKEEEEEEVIQKEDEKHSDTTSTDSSEYEEETESEEDNEPRLKPLFVSKKDRATIQEKEREAQKQKQAETEAKRMAKERRRQTLRMVEESVKKELEKAKVRRNF